jgi:DNA-binding GntR family transcriptional regulator
MERVGGSARARSVVPDRQSTAHLQDRGRFGARQADDQEVERSLANTKFESLTQQPMSHVIVERLSEAIVSGRLKPGAQIVQSQLAAELGVSRAPLREALNKLEEEGLVVNVPYKGTIVALLDRRDVEELRSLRLVMEQFAASLLIEHLTDDELSELEAIFEEMKRAAEQGNEALVDVADLKFHSKIFELSKHGLLFEIWKMYEKRFRRVMSLRNKVNRDLHKLVEMHVFIMDALRERDLDALKEFYANHGTDLTDVLVSTWPEEFVNGSK